MPILKTRFEYGDDIPAYAAAALTGGRLVTLAAGGKGTQGKPNVNYTTADTSYVFGATSHDALLGEDITITRRGTVMLLEAHAAIAENASLVPAALGRVQTETATAGRQVIGRALHAVAAQGDKVWCIVDIPGTTRG